MCIRDRYSTQWCGDCVRSKKVFDKLGIDFTEVDIDYDKEGFEIAKKFKIKIHESQL